MSQLLTTVALGALFLSAFYRGTLQTTAETPVPIQRKSFAWKASLNRGTGIASSSETSAFEVGRRDDNSNKDEENIRKPSSKKVRATTKRIAREIFSNYPTFLGRPSLTLGLCRSVVVPSAASTISKDEKHCNLQTSLVPLNVLIFGTPREVTFSQYEKRKDEEVICCVEIPIVGGLMANTNPSSLSAKKSNSKNASQQDYGSLRFTWLHQKLVPNSSGHNSQQKSQSQPNIILVTEIVGKYRPSLAGNILPIPAW
eukprot:CAMPEP_0183722634 /NCGR_PEP_ID=MMETSP0737-20130205/14531_1 /TAXON_ID=385413 /ORGANISM="Thalassiosira miniscula, Strain CCMP1093" /LENGTH=255 /DNA_ID=CAMNT_0025952841 /DNA_START=224 /DNA_END=988 /DNA_ORIENTATION=+